MSTGERSHGVAIGALGGGSTVGTGMLHTEGVKCRNRVVKVPGGGGAAKRRCVRLRRVIPRGVSTTN